MGEKQRAPASGNASLDSAPPFLPLEENMGRPRSNSDPSPEDDVPYDSEEKPPKSAVAKQKASLIKSRMIPSKIDGKKLVMGFLGLFLLTIVYESFFVDPEHRLVQPDFADKFLMWVELNPVWGLGAISLVIAAAVVTLVPIGTPLTLGCGYIYRGVYGWKLGLFVATAVSMAGSCLGAVICFLLGRYLMRETVQQWVRKYPLFDAINVGTSASSIWE